MAKRKPAAPPDPTAPPISLDAALEARYHAPEYALLWEVRNQTGYSRTVRSADAIAMSLWPSRGIELLGFELKRSRSDWVREKDDPAKAEAIASYCDRWWLVVSDAAFVRVGELPPNWGLLAQKGNALVVMQEAAKLDPQPIDRPMLCGIMRNIADTYVSKASIKGLIQAARTEEREAKKQHLSFEHDQDRRALAELRARVSEFETASGVNIANKWHYGYGGNPGQVGAAVRFFLSGGVEHARDQLLSLKGRADTIAQEITDALNGLEKQGGS